MSISTTQIRIELEAPNVDRERDLRLWEDVQGQLIGFGELSIMEPTADNIAG